MKFFFFFFFFFFFSKFYLKVNQVVYSSLLIYSSSFETLVSTVFEIVSWQEFIHIFSKGSNSGKGTNSAEKIKYVSAIFYEESIWDISNQ